MFANIFATFICLSAVAVHDAAFAANATNEFLNDFAENGVGQLTTWRPVQAHQRVVTATSARPSKWISRMFLEAELEFDMSENVTSKCKMDYEKYKLNLQNQTIWAVRMYESSQWPKVGLFAGMYHHFGNYRECLKAEEYGFMGQYCTVEATIDYSINHLLNRQKFDLNDDPPGNVSAWYAMRLFELDFNRADRRHLSWALCVPSTCLPEDIRKSLNETLHPIFSEQGLNIGVRVNPQMCQTKIKRQPPLMTYIFSGIMLFLVFIFVPIVTALEVFWRKNTSDETRAQKILKDLLYLNSAKSTLKKLTHVNKEHTYPLVHALKILCMIIVIGGHRFMLSGTFPQTNTESFEEYTKSKQPELAQTSNIVDICFALSGFLQFHYGYPYLHFMKFSTIFIGTIVKWLRLMIIPTILILEMIFLWPYIGDGPLWNTLVDKYQKACKTNWWLMYLGIQNIVRPDQQCLPHTWYVAVDLQLTFLGLFILWIVAKNKKFGIAVAVSLLISSIMVIYYVTYEHKYDPVLLFTINNTRDINKVIHFQKLHITLYTRIGPYLMGFLSSVLSLKLREKKYKFSNLSMTLLLLGTFAIGIISNLYGLNYYEVQKPYNSVERAAYSALSGMLYTLPFVTLLCIYFTSGLGYLHRITTWDIFVPFGRLAYAIYLIAPCIQMYIISSQESYLPVMNKLNLVWQSSGDVVLSVITSVIMYVLVEVPTRNFLSILTSTIFESNKKS